MEEKKAHAKSPDQLQKNLQEIEEELKKPVDQKKMRRLFQKLETAQEDCSLLKAKYNRFSDSFLPEAENRICSLFGKVMTTHVDSEVDKILKTAQKLSEKDTKGKKQLQKKIEDFKSWHRPSKENLNKLAEAEKLLGKDLKFSTEYPDYEETEKLLELASSVYHKNIRERNKLYLSLSEETKKRFQAHLIQLKTQAFKKENLTLQALFASAFELSGAPIQYPTIEEMREFFEEEEKVSKKDCL